MRRPWPTGGAVAPKTNKQTNKHLNLHDDLLTSAAVRLGRFKSSVEQRKERHLLMSRTYVTRNETRHFDSFVLLVCAKHNMDASDRGHFETSLMKNVFFYIYLTVVLLSQGIWRSHLDHC